jgi:hypothetical protein
MEETEKRPPCAATGFRQVTGFQFSSSSIAKYYRYLE